MTEEEIIQEIEKLELEEEKEKTVKYLLKVVIEGKKDIIQEKEFFLKKKEQEIEELKAENEELINQRTEGFWENDKLKKEIEKLTRLNSAYKTNYDSKVLKEERKNKKILEGYISKDKIKKELKDLEEIKYSAITDIGQAVYNANIALLKRLLEE